MKFTELVYDVIVEEIKNKSTIQYLYKKWLGDNPTDAQKLSVDPLIKFFGEKRDSLSLKQPAVKAFLQKYNGENGDVFDPKNLKDVTKYTLNQVKDLRSEFVNDEINNDAFIKHQIEVWYGPNADEDQKYKAYKMIKWFTKFLPQITPESHEVQSFLYRFDGDHAANSKFDIQNLKDLSKYSLHQIEGLYHEYHDITQEMNRNDEEAFQETGGTSSQPKREASKKLWFGQNNVVFDAPGFKVHYIPDQKTSVKYGYYQQEIRNQLYGYDWNAQRSNITSHWCVTGRGSSDSWTNLWGRYRSEGKTFYFVIDESKKPEEGKKYSGNDNSKYYLGALQKYPRGRTGWILTSLLNDGDQDMTWQQVIQIYPQLKEHEELLKSVEYDPSVELNVDTSLIGRINEQPGSPNEFAKQDPAIKKAYIDEGHPLKTAKSWETLNSYLRNLYIARTEEGNMLNSYSTLEFLNAIKHTPNFYQLLENKIKSLCERSTNLQYKNKGIGVLYHNIIKRDMIIERQSIDSDNILLVRDENDSAKKDFSGLWDIKTMNWAVYDGIQYKNEYKELHVYLYVVKDSGTNLIVNSYSKSNDEDPSSFYVIHPASTNNDLGMAHFVSYNKFQELLSKIEPVNDDEEDTGFTPISKFDPEGGDVDLKEYEY
jgi:hypothetical protein